MLLPLSISAQMLRDYQWKNRLVVLFHPQPKAQQLTDQLSSLRAREKELNERDMLLIVPKMDHQSNLLEDLGIATGFQGVVLVGKDGGVKYKSSFPVSPDLLLDLVDSMPMRRAEIKRRKGK